MSGNVVSHGRGGQGNITKDDTQYTDAGVVREGVQGEGRGPEYSTGRGGAGNIAPGEAERASGEDYVPETNFRPAQSDFHTGRGGGGNVHREKYGGHTHDQEGGHKSLVDKAKDLLHKNKDSDKKAEGSS